MELSVTAGRTRWSLQPAPASNPGFTERTKAAIHPPSGGPWELWIDDERIPLDRGAWRWEPGFYAGEVTAQLLGADGQVVSEYLLDVAPDVKKSGQVQFADMLHEVLSEDPRLVFGHEPATFFGGNELQIEDPFSALLGLARMRVHGPLLVRALHEAARQPRLVVRRRRSEEPPNRVRRVDTWSLRSLARSGAMPAGAGEWDSFESGRALHRVRVDVPVAEPHVDGAANRSVVALMQLVLQRIQLLRERLPLIREKKAATRTGLEGRLPGRLALLERLELDMVRLLRASPWKDVSRAEMSAAGLNTLAADPLYARIYQMAWRALRMGLGKDEAEDRLWLSPTWELFERWCFVRLARQLRELLQLTWTRSGPGEHASEAAAAWIGTSATSTVHLLLQPKFHGQECAPSWGFRSISLKRIPDLVITREEAGRRRFFVLDGKYRVDEYPVLQEMEAAHIYRDSLRWHEARPEFALLLLPAESPARWLADPAFHREHGVGTAVLGAQLPELLRAALASPSP